MNRCGSAPRLLFMILFSCLFVPLSLKNVKPFSAQRTQKNSLDVACGHSLPMPTFKGGETFSSCPCIN